MTASLDDLVELVAAHGMARHRARIIAEYLADRCSSLSLASLHSSSHSSLRFDRYLVDELGLDRHQVSAWIALIRGTRAVHRRDGRTVGGFPGLLESLHRGPLRPEQRRRFERLAHVASGCGCTVRADREA
jgi:hypothetical protein